MDRRKELTELYLKNSKHSGYQILSSNLQKVININDFKIKSTYEKERLEYILKKVNLKDKKILGLIQYLEQRGVPVYSPRSERFFNRSEVKQIIGCILLCFKEAVDIVRDPDFIQYCQHLDAYYNEECILAAKRLVREHPDTLGRWMQQRRQEHETHK